jgi:hypothetical protein
LYLDGANNSIIVDESSYASHKILASGSASMMADFIWK